MAAITAIPNLGSQLERAVVAYLVSVEAGTYDDTFESYCSMDKVLPNTVVRASGSTHEPLHGGNEVWQLSVIVRGIAVDDADTESRYAAVGALNERVGKCLAAMLQTEDNQTLDYTAEQITAAGRALAVSDPDNHADMADFTCQSIYYKGAQRGQPEEDNSIWAEMRNFEVRCCASAIS